MQAFDTIKRRLRPRQSAEGGFSLVEILIAMTILSVGLMALAQMQIVAMHLNQSNTYRAQAEILAQEQMERVINATWGANLAALDGTATVTRNEKSYSVVTTVGPVVALNTTFANTRPVTVSVTYNDGHDRTVVFNTTKSQAEDPQ